MYRRRWVILGVLNLSLLIVVIANTSLNVALPTMARDLELSNSAQQWVVDAYSLVFAGLLFTAGSLGDRWGRKRFLQAGIAVFGLASLYGTLFVDSGASLIVTRAVMGIGGAKVDVAAARPFDRCRQQRTTRRVLTASLCLATRALRGSSSVFNQEQAGDKHSRHAQHSGRL